MSLLKEIKQSRKEKKEKQLIDRDVYTQIGCIVKQYGLDRNFLGLLDNPCTPPAAPSHARRARPKALMECPPFSLLTEKDYELTRSIIRKIDNPYLQYAASPDEIQLSNLLYRRNPAISRERLMRFHFETLLHYELSRSAGIPEPRHGT